MLTPKKIGRIAMEVNRKNKSSSVRGIFVILAAVAVVWTACEKGYCRTITVRADGSGDYPTIQAAIDDANDGDEVVLDPGTYRGDGNRDIDFLGKAITVRSTDPNDSNVVGTTVIDCNGTETEWHRGFNFTNGEDSNSVLAGVTIVRGYASGDWPDSMGGGIYCFESSPKIGNCRIMGNIARYSGGGIYCYRGSPIIRNCVVSDNTAENWGDGGGINCSDSQAVITNCVISGNSAGGWGGGIYNDLSKLVISNCTIRSNSGHYGGGISCYSSRGTTISNCTITKNQGEEGGGIRFSGGEHVIKGCKITGNVAGTGGGICFRQVCSRYNGLTVTSCTIVGNAALDKGGGIFVDDSSDEEIIFITNCILRGNARQQIAAYCGTMSVKHSNIEGGWIGLGNIDANPLFTQSGFWDMSDVWVAGDYHLLRISPCIDAGTNDPAGGLGETDLDGKACPFDGDGDGLAVADMGAYEYPVEADGPVIGVNRCEFMFFGEHGGAGPEAQVLQIRNLGVGKLRWDVVADCNWLGVTPMSGVSTGEVEEVTLSVDANGLAEGYYDGTVRVVGVNTANRVVAVRIELAIGRVLHVPEEHSTIQSAIDAAADNDIVVVEDGTYTGPGNRDITFRGKAITVKSENGPDNCIIDCENSGRGFSLRSRELEGSVVEGFTIRNGSGQRGAGIRCEDSSPTIINCRITGSSSDNGGTGIYIYSGIVKIVSCSITGNNGSGIWCRQGIARIKNCTVSNNEGAGIYCQSEGRAGIANCKITKNLDGVYSEGAELLMTACTISDNRGTGVFGASSELRPVITDCTVRNNSGEYSWGGILCVGDLMVENSVVGGNLATYSGGGVSCGGNLVMNNCTVSGNSADSLGGGIFFLGESIITNCTIIGNRAGEEEYLLSGGIHCGDGATTITNCIIWDNLPYEIGDPGGVALTTYSDVAGGWGGEGNIDADPCFVEVGYWADACDVNIVVEPNDPNAVWIDGDYRLLEGSPCIDAGDPNYVAGPNETDVDGNPRVADGDEDGNSVVDMGAYEFTIAEPVEPVEMLAELGEMVEELGLGEGVESSLLAKLEAAIGLLEDDNEKNDGAAVNILGAFINAASAQSGKKIPESGADALIAEAASIIEALESRA